MADLEVRNDSMTTIQVKFNDASNFTDIKPGGAKVSSTPGTYLVAKSKTEVFEGGFSGVANVKIASELTTANPKFVAKNNNEQVVVVTYGSKEYPLQQGQSKSSTDPGNYVLTFQDPSYGGAIVSINFPNDIDSVTLIVS